VTGRCAACLLQTDGKLCSECDSVHSGAFVGGLFDMDAVFSSRCANARLHGARPRPVAGAGKRAFGLPGHCHNRARSTLRRIEAITTDDLSKATNFRAQAPDTGGSACAELP
jgi:hypothetical protein